MCDLCRIVVEGLDVSQVPVRPRGRPSGRFFLSSFMTQAADVASHAGDMPPLKMPSFDEATDLRTPRPPGLLGDVAAFREEVDAATDLTMAGSRRPTPDDVKSCLSEVRLRFVKRSVTVPTCFNLWAFPFRMWSSQLSIKQSCR